MNENVCELLNTSSGSGTREINKTSNEIRSYVRLAGITLLISLPSTTQEQISTDLSLLQTVTIYPSLFA